MPTQSVRVPNRWAVLGVMSVAQLMVVLDATIVTVALPSAQRALHFSTGNRQWIVTAYALAFGSLLLLGGKLGDLFGRKWALIAGLVGFSGASAIGGLAQSFDVLVAARALQGVFAALLAPSALSILTVTFAGSEDRDKAFGIYGGVAGGAGALGLLLGGALTQGLSWRWTLYVNLVIAVPTTIVALRLLVNQSDPDRPRIDIPGVLTWSLGLFALVYGFSNAATHGWGATATVVSLVASPLLLTSFVLIERRVKHPLLPLGVVWNRARGGAYVALLLTGAGLLAMFLFLTYFVQQNLAFSPLKTGVAFLPLTVVLILASTTAQIRVIPRTGVKPVLLLGMGLCVVGMGLLTQLTPTSSYGTGVLPALLVIGVGMGCIFAPAFSAATLGVAPNEAGIASGMVNTSQQIGGSVGTSLLSTIYATAFASYVNGHPHVRGVIPAAAVHGDTTAFWWSTAIFGLGFLLTLLIVPGRCEGRSATTIAALARHAIGNCHHVETEEGAALSADRGSPPPMEPSLVP